MSGPLSNPNEIVRLVRVVSIDPRVNQFSGPALLPAGWSQCVACATPFETGSREFGVCLSCCETLVSVERLPIAANSLELEREMAMLKAALLLPADAPFAEVLAAIGRLMRVGARGDPAA